MKLSLAYLFFIFVTCSPQANKKEIIDPVSEMPFEVLLQSKEINLSESDTTIRNGLLDIRFKIDSLGNIAEYKIRVVKINFYESETILFINGNPEIENNEITPIAQHLPQIESFVRNSIVVKKRFPPKKNEYYMSVFLRIKGMDNASDL